MAPIRLLVTLHFAAPLLYWSFSSRLVERWLRGC
jgi:hypothetical protein